MNPDLNLLAQEWVNVDEMVQRFKTATEFLFVWIALFECKTSSSVHMGNIPLQKASTESIYSHRQITIKLFGLMLLLHGGACENHSVWLTHSDWLASKSFYKIASTHFVVLHSILPTVSRCQIVDSTKPSYQSPSPLAKFQHLCTYLSLFSSWRAHSFPFTKLPHNHFLCWCSAWRQTKILRL